MLEHIVGMYSDNRISLLKMMATPAGIEPATNSLEVVRKLNVFNAHSDKTAVSAALSNKTKFQFVGMRYDLRKPVRGRLTATFAFAFNLGRFACTATSDLHSR